MKAKSSNGLGTAWVVGEVFITADDASEVTVAWTKTAARRKAEARLAQHAVTWDEYRQCHERHGEPDRESKGLTMLAYATLRNNLPAYRAWLALYDGIMLTGPHGERVHIAKPSKAAVERLLKAKRANRRETDRLLSHVIVGLAQFGLVKGGGK